MDVRNTRRRQFQLEGLERREVLSAALAVSGLSVPEGSAVPNAVGPLAHPAIPHAVSFVGNGKTLPPIITPLANGGFETSARVSGFSTQLGIYNGVITLDFAPDGRSFAGGAIFNSILFFGDQIGLTITGSLHSLANPTHFHARFQVIGGAGRFANATGSGTLSGLADTQFHTERFTFHGSIVP
jgi:hypothetical protein